MKQLIFQTRIITQHRIHGIVNFSNMLLFHSLFRLPALYVSAFFSIWCISVTEFSKKTGDYRSLSATDLRVVALAYMLEKEFVGTDHIKAAPERKVVVTQTKRTLEKATEVAGFYLGPKEVCVFKFLKRLTPTVN